MCVVGLIITTVTDIVYVSTLAAPVDGVLVLVDVSNQLTLGYPPVKIEEVNF